MSNERMATVDRETRETRISATVRLDGEGLCEVATGVGFFDHMLAQLARHSGMDLDISAEGDLQVDAHHTVEDCGIVLGQAVAKALGDCAGIERYGWALVPMEEALAEVAVDISGRPKLVFRAEFPSPATGDFDVQLVEEFWTAFVLHAKVTLHVGLRYGHNTHHCVEAIFKAAARALRSALAVSGTGIPSTKGVL